MISVALSQSRYEPGDSLQSDGDYLGSESMGLSGIFIIVVGFIVVANVFKWFFKMARTHEWFDKLTLYGFIALCAYNVYYCSKH